MAVREVTPPLQVVCKWKIDESIFDFLLFATWNPTIMLANIREVSQKKKKSARTRRRVLFVLFRKVHF